MRHTWRLELAVHALAGPPPSWAPDAQHMWVFYNALLAPAGVANCVAGEASRRSTASSIGCPEYHASPASDTPILYCGVNHGARGADTLNARLLHTAFPQRRTQQILGLEGHPHVALALALDHAPQFGGPRRNNMDPSHVPTIPKWGGGSSFFSIQGPM